MKRFWIAGVAVVGSICVSPTRTSAEGAEETPWWTWQEVAPGVTAVLQPVEERFNDANVVLIEWGESGLVMVDAPAKAEHLQTLLDEIDQRLGRRVKWVINTHWHSDHTQGNARIRGHFGTDVTVVGHVSLLEDVPGRAAPQVHERVVRLEELLPEAEKQLALGRDERGNELDPDQVEAQERGIARAQAWLDVHRDVEFQVPDVLVRDSLTLHDGQRRIEISAHRAHTRGDLVVHLPGERVLITGDLLDDLPYIGHGYPRSWIETLDGLAALAPEIIVPGHGPVFEGTGPEGTGLIGTGQLERVRDLLQSLVDQVAAGIAKGLDGDELIESVDLSEARAELARDEAAERFFDGVAREAIERTAADLRGELEEAEISRETEVSSGTAPTEAGP